VRKLINVDIKKGIISKPENGKSVGDLSAECGLVKSTIYTVLKDKEEIKSVQVTKELSRLTFRCRNFLLNFSTPCI